MVPSGTDESSHVSEIAMIWIWFVSSRTSNSESLFLILLAFMDTQLILVLDVTVEDIGEGGNVSIDVSPV